MASVGLIDGNYVSGSRGYGSWMLYDVVCSIARPGKVWKMRNGQESFSTASAVSIGLEIIH
jgi:hypothetical protein